MIVSCLGCQAQMSNVHIHLLTLIINAMIKHVRFLVLSLLTVLGFGVNQVFADGTFVDGLYYLFDNGNRGLCPVHATGKYIEYYPDPDSGNFCSI